MDPDTRTRPSTFLLKDDVDIFGYAGSALTKFLFPLAVGDYNSNYKVVQIGDLFELWQGMDRWGTFFQKSKGGVLLFDPKEAPKSIRVSDSPKSRVYEVYWDGPIDLLAHRVQGILLQHWRVFYSLDILRKQGKMEYLYGNHDVYLVDKLREYHLKSYNDTNAKWRQIIGNVPLLKTHLFESNVAFEHGHRMDSFNSDGDWRGQFITEAVFVAPFLRELDPDRRSMYHNLSAADVYYHRNFLGKPISVFVMGHTHSAQLAYIQYKESR